MLYATTSALVYSLAAEHGQPDSLLGPPYNDVVRFVEAQRARLNPLLRVPLLVATVGFGLAGLVHGRACFHRQAPDRRARQVAAWRDARLPPCRDLIRFYESLTVLALYSRPGIAGAAPDEAA